MDSPNQPAIRPRRAAGTPAMIHGCAPENSAASPAPITSRAISSNAIPADPSCPATNWPTPPSAVHNPPINTTGLARPASAIRPAIGRVSAVARNAMPTASPTSTGPPWKRAGTNAGSTWRVAPSAKYPNSTAQNSRATGRVGALSTTDMVGTVRYCLISGQGE